MPVPHTDFFPYLSRRQSSMTTVIHHIYIVLGIVSDLEMI
jgi:hypothetical protein